MPNPVANPVANPDILFVGAGPVGLFAAIQAKLTKPELQIKMFERNKDYTRDYTLHIDKKSYDKSCSDSKFKELLSTLTGTIQTKEIESKLKEFALNLGIEIVYEPITEPEKLFERFPTAHTLVGSDGARSIVRKKLFKNEKSLDTQYKHLVKLTYQVEDTTEKLNSITYLPALGAVEHLVVEQVGTRNTKDNTRPVSLLFFVDNATYKDIQELDTQYMKKHNCKSGRLPISALHNQTNNIKKLVNSMRPWLALRRVTFGDKIVQGSDYIAGVDLSAYASESFAKIVNQNKRVLLLGDAGFGVPFQLSLNSGLMRAILATKFLVSGEKNKEQDVKTLNEIMLKHIKEIIKKVDKKDFTVALGMQYQYSKSLFGVRHVNQSVLISSAHSAMQNAKITKSNFFDRNPRLTIGAISWGLIFLVSFAILLSLMLTATGFGVPVLGVILSSGFIAVLASSLAIPSLILGLTGFIIQVGKIIRNLFLTDEDKNRNLRCNPLPWEKRYKGRIEVKKVITEENSQDNYDTNDLDKGKEETAHIKPEYTRLFASAHSEHDKTPKVDPDKPPNLSK